jgi:hypothetical protein
MGTGLSLGIGIPFRRMGAGIDAQAQAHYNRVIADGGLIPSGLVGVNNFFTTVKAIYGTSDITTAISVGLDAQVLGYKLGAGAGTTAGQAAQKLYSCSGSSGDVVQTTAASQPLLLVHSGANYWQGVGVAGNFVRTPNAAANQITGNIEITAQINPLVLNIDQNIVNKSGVSGVTMGYNFFLNSAGGLNFSFSPTGSVATRTTVSSTVSLSSVGLSANSIFWVKITRNATSGDIEFFTSTNGTTFSQLGATINSLIGNLFNSTEQLNIGTWGDVLHYFTGKIYRATISNSIGGAPVVDFNPSQYNAANSQTQWVSTSGETWTINTGTAATGYKGVLVDRTIVQGDGIGDDLISGTIANKQFFTSYIACNLLSFSGRIRGGNATLQQIIFGSASNLDMYGGANSITFTGETPNRLQLLTANYAASPNAYTRINSLARNNPAINIGNAISNKISIFSDANTLFSNININTVIESVTNDPLNDAMYNYIRSINNNAF